MCCSFNLAKAEEMFHEGKFASSVKKQQTVDSDNAFDTKREGLENWNEEVVDQLNSGTIVPKPGATKGLSVVLDSHSDLISSTSLRHDGQGFRVIVGSRKVKSL